MQLNLVNIIDQVGKDKGIDKEVLIDALESAMLKAAEKRFGAGKEIEAHYQEETGEIELFLLKTAPAQCTPTVSHRVVHGTLSAYPRGNTQSHRREQ